MHRNSKQISEVPVHLPMTLVLQKCGSLSPMQIFSCAQRCKVTRKILILAHAENILQYFCLKASVFTLRYHSSGTTTSLYYAFTVETSLVVT